MKTRGISILEVLIVLLIISGGLMVVTRMNVTNIATSGHTKHHTTAGFICQGVLEDLKTHRFNSPSLELGVHQVGGSVVYNTTYTVEFVPNPPHKVVTVVTTWTDNSGLQQVYRLSAIFYSIGTVKFEDRGYTSSSANSSSSSSSSSSGRLK